MSKGSDDTRSPNFKARRDGYDKINWSKRRCEHWDCGWCYKKNTKYTNGCVGIKECKYEQAK